MPASGSATPYPSQLAVDHPGPVVDVNVSLLLSHTRPDDLDLLLVGPQGQAVVLMSDAGGANAVEDLRIDIDDEVDQAMPDDDPLDGTEPEFEPTDYDDGAGRLPRPGSSTQRDGALGLRRQLRRRELEPVRRGRLRRRVGHDPVVEARDRSRLDGLPVRAAGLGHRAGHRRGRLAPRLRHPVRLGHQLPAGRSARTAGTAARRRRGRQRRGRHGQEPALRRRGAFPGARRTIPSSRRPTSPPATRTIRSIPAAGSCAARPPGTSDVPGCLRRHRPQRDLATLRLRRARARTSPRSTAGRCTSSGTTPPPRPAPSRWTAAPPGRETSRSSST